MKIQNISGCVVSQKTWDEVVDENGRHWRDDWEPNDQTDFAHETLILNKGEHTFFSAQERKREWEKEFLECFEEEMEAYSYNLKQARNRNEQ